MAHKVVRGRLEARDWALSGELAFSLSARLSPENFGIGSFCVSQQVAVECQVKLRVPPQTPFLTNQFFIFLLGGNEEPRRDPSVYGFSCHYLVRSSRSALVMMMTALFAHIRRCVALFTSVVIWHQGVGLILAGWHYAAVTDKKKKLLPVVIPLGLFQFSRQLHYL